MSAETLTPGVICSIDFVPGNPEFLLCEDLARSITATVPSTPSTIITLPTLSLTSDLTSAPISSSAIGSPITIPTPLPHSSSVSVLSTSFTSESDISSSNNPFTTVSSVTTVSGPLTPSPFSSPQLPQRAHQLSQGTIAGVAVGSTAITTLLVVSLFLWFCKMKRQKEMGGMQRMVTGLGGNASNPIPYTYTTTTTTTSPPQSRPLSTSKNAMAISAPHDVPPAPLGNQVLDIMSTPALTSSPLHNTIHATTSEQTELGIPPAYSEVAEGATRGDSNTEPRRAGDTKGVQVVTMTRR